MSVVRSLAPTSDERNDDNDTNERAGERGSEKKRRADYDGKYAIIARKREESATRVREREISVRGHREREFVVARPPRRSIFRTSGG